MKKKVMLFAMLSLLLGGCWDNDLIDRCVLLQPVPKEVVRASKMYAATDTMQVYRLNQSDGMGGWGDWVFVTVKHDTVVAISRRKP